MKVFQPNLKKTRQSLWKSKKSILKLKNLIKDQEETLKISKIYASNYILAQLELINEAYRLIRTYKFLVYHESIMVKNTILYTA